MDRTALNNTAKELAMTVDNMLQSARNAAASAKEDPDGEMPLLDSAKAVAEAVAKMLKVTKDLVSVSSILFHPLYILFVTLISL